MPRSRLRRWRAAPARELRRCSYRLAFAAARPAPVGPRAQRHPRTLDGELVDREVTEVASSYIDVWGRRKEGAPETQAALLEALGPIRSTRKKIKIEKGCC